MKIVVCDITGRTINYNVALCEAIHDELEQGDSLEHWSAGLTKVYPFKTQVFTSFVPLKYRGSAKPIFRVLKALETLYAYIWIVFKLAFTKIDVFHLQWFPFITLGTTGSSIDIFFIKLMKAVSPKTKMVYTIHNLCPHKMKEEERAAYNPVYSKALRLFDEFIVHTERTKDEVVESLWLDANKIHVVYHGIFNPKDFTFEPINKLDGKVRIIAFGFHNPYKGTDIFTKALAELPTTLKERISVHICGEISDSYFEECNAPDVGIDIKWTKVFLPDNKLYQYINDSDIIVLPYRRISQSGVLLLALNTRRIIITSDLPTFKETLKGFPEDAFFKSEDPKDMARVIADYCNGNINTQSIMEAIENLNVLYSWSESAKKTIKLYKALV